MVARLVRDAGPTIILESRLSIGRFCGKSGSTSPALARLGETSTSRVTACNSGPSEDDPAPVGKVRVPNRNSHESEERPNGPNRTGQNHKNREEGPERALYPNGTPERAGPRSAVAISRALTIQCSHVKRTGKHNQTTQPSLVSPRTRIAQPNPIQYNNNKESRRGLAVDGHYGRSARRITSGTWRTPEGGLPACRHRVRRGPPEDRNPVGVCHRRSHCRSSLDSGQEERESV